MNKKRENGYYWVMIQTRSANKIETQWKIAEFVDFFWIYGGCSWDDHNFIEIDERIIKRQN